MRVLLLDTREECMVQGLACCKVLRLQGFRISGFCRFILEWVAPRFSEMMCDKGKTTQRRRQGGTDESAGQGHTEQ